jgi:hypothetical protein
MLLSCFSIYRPKLATNNAIMFPLAKCKCVNLGALYSTFTYFCCQSFVFPAFQIYNQTTEEEEVGKDWRTITFRQDHAIHLKRTHIVYTWAWEQTEENASMLFVMSAMRNVQKHIRDLGVASSVKMSWSSLVAMSYAICRFVLTCGGVPGIIWEVHSGLIVQKVVPSVRGRLMCGISEWGCFV